MKIKYLLYILLFSILFSCKKDADEISKQTISGMVYNQCTDSGMANVEVFLKINRDNSSIQSIKTVSGLDGLFSFPNIDLHKNDKYSYVIFIPSKSGINGGGGTEVGFNGSSIGFKFSEASTFFKPKVIPCFFSLCYESNIEFPILGPDSLYIYFEQKIYHKNIPYMPYNGTISNNSTIYMCTQNYPMGLWNVTIDKWKGGLHTTELDSIYLDWGATKTYTFNW
jgi:hypothetical protein